MVNKRWVDGRREERKITLRYKGAVRKRNTTSQDTFIPNALLDYKKTKMLEGGSCHRVKLLNLYFSLPNELLLKMSHEAPLHNHLKHTMSTGKAIL